ncbi:hypothetical protein ACWDTT_33370 [Streptosporangium sandarakinum]
MSTTSARAMQPYGIPHLTVAHGQQAHVLDEAEAALTARLPITANVTLVSLFVSDGDRWHSRAEFPLLG